ncbi:Glycosyl transferase 4-like domain protein [anaerobic digester metagenome]
MGSQTIIHHFYYTMVYNGDGNYPLEDPIMKQVSPVAHSPAASGQQSVKMILTNRFDPDVRVYKEARYLTAQGFDVEILCWDRENEYARTEVVDGIRIRRFNPPAVYGTGLQQLVPYIKFLRQVRQYLKTQEYAYLHCHDLDGMIVGAACRSANPSAKLIFDMHEIYEVQGKKQKIRRLVRALVSRYHGLADAILYVNELQLEHMSPANRKKLIHLPNYPDAANFSSDEKTVSPLLRVSYIGSVRHFQQMKNLLDAASGAEGVYTSIHGFGTAYKQLQELEAGYPNAQVTGPYHFQESTRLFSEADLLYIMYPMDTLQNRESEPIKFFEAIITRTPMIVSPLSRLAQYVTRYGIGYLVDGEDIGEIRRLLAHIATHREELAQMRERMKSIQFQFTWDHVVKDLSQIYQSDPNR